MNGCKIRRAIAEIAIQDEDMHHIGDEELQKLFALTACTFEALQTRCDVRCPEEFAKLYAAELCE